MSNSDLENLKFSVMGGLPAAEKKYTIEEFKEMLLSYNCLLYTSDAADE